MCDFSVSRWVNECVTEIDQLEALGNINAAIKGAVSSQVKFEVVSQGVGYKLDQDLESKSTDWGFAGLENCRSHHQEGNVTVFPNAIMGVRTYFVLKKNENPTRVKHGPFENNTKAMCAVNALGQLPVFVSESGEENWSHRLQESVGTHEDSMRNVGMGILKQGSAISVKGWILILSQLNRDAKVRVDKALRPDDLHKQQGCNECRMVYLPQCSQAAVYAAGLTIDGDFLRVVAELGSADRGILVTVSQDFEDLSRTLVHNFTELHSNRGVLGQNLGESETLGKMLIKIMSRLIDCGYLPKLGEEYYPKGGKRYDEYSVVELLEEASNDFNENQNLTQKPKKKKMDAEEGKEGATGEGGEVGQKGEGGEELQQFEQLGEVRDGDVLFGVLGSNWEGGRTNFRRLQFAPDTNFKTPVVLDPSNMGGMSQRKFNLHWNHFICDDAERFLNYCNKDKDYVKQRGVKDLTKATAQRLRTMFGGSRQETEKNTRVEEYINQMVVGTTLFHSVSKEEALLWIIGSLVKMKEALIGAKVGKEGKQVKDFDVTKDYIYKNYDPARVLNCCREEPGLVDSESKRKLEAMAAGGGGRSTRARTQSDAGSGALSQLSGKK
jgi:hypothetical protein